MGNDLFDSPLYQSKRQSNKPLEEQSLEKKRVASYCIGTNKCLERTYEDIG